MFDGLYPAGLQWYWNADFFTDLTTQTIDLHLQYARQLPASIRPCTYTHQRRRHGVGEQETAWSYREANFAQVIVGVDPDPANNPRTIAWSKEYWQAMHPDSGGGYVNMIMDEGQERVKPAYRDNYPRLADQGKVRSGQPLPGEPEHQAAGHGGIAQLACSTRADRGTIRKPGSGGALRHLILVFGITSSRYPIIRPK